jgi:hypothetical protein
MDANARRVSALHDGAHALPQPKLTRELAREGEVGAPVVRLIQDIEILVREPYAAEAIAAIRAVGGLYEIGAADAALAGVAVGARGELA